MQGTNPFSVPLSNCIEPPKIPKKTNNHHRIDEEEGRTRIMKRAPTDEPNLDDILARDFAELNVGEEKITTEAAPDAVQEEQQVANEPVNKPIIYNQKINALEDRDSFTVPPPTRASSATNESDEPKPAEAAPVLKAPTSQLGDDFDVEW